MNLWRSILKNIILSKLLVGKLLGENFFLVSHSIVKLSKENRLILAKAKGTNENAKYMLANIMVQMKDGICSIGYPFQTQFVSEDITIPARISVVKQLKFLTNVIFTHYPPLACKLDSIFSQLPPSLCLLLERNNISRSYWKRGLSHVIKNTEGNIDEKELDDYYKLLSLKLLDLRILNTILIGLLKDGFFKKETDAGELTVTEALVDKEKIVQIIFSDHTTEKFYSAIFNYQDLSMSSELTEEKTKETLNEIFCSLRKIFNAQFR